MHVLVFITILIYISFNVGNAEYQFKMLFLLSKFPIIFKGNLKLVFTALKSG